MEKCIRNFEKFKLFCRKGRDYESAQKDKEGSYYISAYLTSGTFVPLDENRCAQLQCNHVFVGNQFFF